MRPPTGRTRTRRSTQQRCGRTRSPSAASWTGSSTRATATRPSACSKSGCACSRAPLNAVGDPPTRPHRRPAAGTARGTGKAGRGRRSRRARWPRGIPGVGEHELLGPTIRQDRVEHDATNTDDRTEPGRPTVARPESRAGPRIARSVNTAQHSGQQEDPDRGHRGREQDIRVPPSDDRAIHQSEQRTHHVPDNREARNGERRQLQNGQVDACCSSRLDGSHQATSGVDGKTSEPVSTTVAR